MFTVISCQYTTKRMHTKFAQTYSLKPIVRSNVLSPIIYRADNAKLVHTPKYLQKYVVYKATQNRRTNKNLDDLKCSPGSDIESRDLFSNVGAYYSNIFCKVEYSNEIYRPNNLMLQITPQGH